MKTLLWIDDDEELIDASIPVFQRNGFLIIKATNTSRALSMLRAEKLDGVLLDVRLHGGENGLELLKEIHRIYPSLRIAIFTGYPEYDDQINAGELGAAAYLTKIRKSLPLAPDKQRRFFQSLDKIFPERKYKSANRSIAIVLLILGVVITLVANIATNTLPKIFESYFWLSWPILFILVVISALLMRK